MKREIDREGDMFERVNEVLRDLERIRESMLMLSDDVWLNIDHNNDEALEEGYHFKKAYNEKMTAFDKLSEELTLLVQGYTKINPFDLPTPIRGKEADEGHEEGGDASEVSRAENDRIVRELDREKRHELGEDFRYKRPYGFVLKGIAVKDLVTWRKMLQAMCRVLSRIDNDTFLGLPDSDTFVSNRGLRYISRDPSELRLASAISDEIFVEANLSANNTRNIMAKLLDEFGVAASELCIYLREDRDASAET